MKVVGGPEISVKDLSNTYADCYDKSQMTLDALLNGFVPSEDLWDEAERKENPGDTSGGFSAFTNHSKELATYLWKEGLASKDLP